MQDICNIKDVRENQNLRKRFNLRMEENYLGNPQNLKENPETKSLNEKYAAKINSPYFWVWYSDPDIGMDPKKCSQCEEPTDIPRELCLYCCLKNERKNKLENSL